MTDPTIVIPEIHADALALDELGKKIDTALERFDTAEAAWEVVYDAVAESLKEEMAEEGRKGDPAEHTIVATTRRQHRAVWQEYRRAKRALEVLQTKLRAKQAALSGRQSELAALRAESRVQDLAAQAPPVRTFGATRAA